MKEVKDEIAAYRDEEEQEEEEASSEGDSGQAIAK